MGEVGQGAGEAGLATWSLDFDLSAVPSQRRVSAGALRADARLLLASPS